MKYSITKNAILNGFYFLFIFILIKTIVKSFLHGYSKETWNIAEFLINYQGGFVRRGLLGELIFIIHNLTGINPYSLIMLICFSGYIILIWFFLKSFIRKGYSIFVLPFVFFLGDPVFHNFWVRKDVLLILFFIATIYFATIRSRLSLFLVNLFLIIGLLIHESIGFFCLPILFFLLVSKNNEVYKLNNTSGLSITMAILQIAPAIIAFLLVLYFHGSQDISNSIWNSWKPITFPQQELDDSKIPLAINALSSTLEQGLSFTRLTIMNFDFGIYAPIAWLIILLLIYFVMTNISELNFKIWKYEPKNNIDKSNVSNVLIFQLLSLMPVFILGWDYGRWVFYWTASSIAILLLLPEEVLKGMFPKSIWILSAKINSFLALFLSNSNVLICCMLIGFSSYSWSLDESIMSNSLYVMVHFFSNLLRHLLLHV